jgi:hypothetical protein
MEAQLAVEAQACGLALDRYLEKIVSTRPLEPPASQSPAEAVEAIRALRKGIRLDGVTISGLIREGRRY